MDHASGKNKQINIDAVLPNKLENRDALILR